MEDAIDAGSMAVRQHGSTAEILATAPKMSNVKTPPNDFSVQNQK